MNINVNPESMKKLKEINPWGVGAIFVLIMNILFVAYWGYMTLDVKRMEREIASKEEILLSKNRELNKEKIEPGYMRYQAAKEVFRKASSTKITEQNSYLIQLVMDLVDLDKQDNSLELNNLKITKNGIKLNGNSVSIKNIYREGGIIDKFLAFDFIKTIDIPYYRKTEDETFSFLLDAKIKGHDG